MQRFTTKCNKIFGLGTKTTFLASQMPFFCKFGNSNAIFTDFWHRKCHFTRPNGFKEPFEEIIGPAIEGLVRAWLHKTCEPGVIIHAEKINYTIGGQKKKKK